MQKDAAHDLIVNSVHVRERSGVSCPTSEGYCPFRVNVTIWLPLEALLRTMMVAERAPVRVGWNVTLIVHVPPDSKPVPPIGQMLVWPKRAGFAPPSAIPLLTQLAVVLVLVTVIALRCTGGINGHIAERDRSGSGAHCRSSRGSRQRNGAADCRGSYRDRDRCRASQVSIRCKGQRDRTARARSQTSSADWTVLSHPEPTLAYRREQCC